MKRALDIIEARESLNKSINNQIRDFQTKYPEGVVFVRIPQDKSVTNDYIELGISVNITQVDFTGFSEDNYSKECDHPIHTTFHQS